MTGIEVVAAKALAVAATKPILDRVKRQEKVVALLKKIKLDQKIPPRDFEGIYVYTLIEYCYGRPEPIIKFFRLEHIREAFRESFESGDPRHLDREAEEIISWNDETGQLGRIDYDLRREFAGFTAVFQTLVDRSRGAAEARAERKIDGLQEQLANLNQHLASLSSIEAVREVVDAPANGHHDPIGWLASETKSWFNAIGYEFEEYLEPSNGSFLWIIKVPARRRFDRVVVLGMVGEAVVADVARAEMLMEKHHADEAWIVVPRRVSASAREASVDRVACFTLDELIDQDADFDAYIDWLISEVESRGISNKFVSPHCKKDEYERTGEIANTRSIYDDSSGGLEGYVQGWLADPSKEHLSVLGEFGTGKSWFCLHFSWQLALQYQSAKRKGLPRPRLPLLIPLRDYAKAVSVESLFSEFFFRKHQVQLAGYSVFEYLNRSGRLMLIFDGFDEMASRVDRQARINNFWELAKVVVPGAKVLLTCRTEHFPEARESRALLSAQLKASTQALTGTPPQFEVVDLMPFDDAQIRQLLGHLTEQAVVEAIMRHDQLLDLMRRPVMSELVLDALPEIQEGREIDLSRVYMYAVRRKMDRDIQAERTFTSMSDKVFFLCEVSWEMLSTDTMSMNYRQFPDRIRRCFGAVVEEERDLDHWHHDMLGQSMLIRNSVGDYSPAHRSLLEFFVAYKFGAELGILNSDFLTMVQDVEGDRSSVRWSEYFHREDPGTSRPTVDQFKQENMSVLSTTFGHTQLSPAVLQLMLPMLDKKSAKSSLIDLICQTRNQPADSVGLVGGNSASLLARHDPQGMRCADLQDTNLRGARLDLMGTSKTDLTGANLRNADLSDTDFENVILRDADLTGANLTHSFYFGQQKTYSESMVAYPDTLVASTHSGELLLWKYKDAASEPQRLMRLDQSRSAILERMAKSSGKLGVLCGETLIIDVNTGSIDLKVPGTHGYIPIFADDYRGVITFHSPSTGEDVVKLHNLDGVRRLDTPFDILPKDWIIDFFDPTDCITRVVDPTGEIWVMDASTDNVVRAVPAGRIDSDEDDDDRSGLGTIRYSGGNLWSIRRSNEDSLRIDRYSTTGKSISCGFIEAPRRDLTALGAASLGFAIEFDPISQVAVIAGGLGIHAIQVDSWESKWAEPDLPGVLGLHMSRDIPGILVASRYGDISVRDIESGAVTNCVVVGTDNQGVKVGRSSGLRSAVIAALERGGAIIVD
ncbi:pentapeptide repeat-containing protein [Lentzea sp. NPDC058450]|uniref:pentapeptide repeat-containing protein n=1 Tax=Lentzea sp. NPDC058450 TaxID=3346505 RepID=UPI0036645699